MICESNQVQLIVEDMLRKGIIVAIAVIICITGAVIVWGRFTTETFYFTCTVCRQQWTDRTTKLWEAPVWTVGGRHAASDHAPTFDGGGYSRLRWTLLGGEGAIGCGRHSLRSP